MNLCVKVIQFIKSKFVSAQNYWKFSIVDFLVDIEIDKIEFYKIEKFMEVSKLAQKVYYFNKFNNHQTSLSNNNNNKESNTTPTSNNNNLHGKFNK